MRNNEKSGPFTMDQLKGMWSNGQITSETPYWFDGLSEWLPIEGMVEEAIREEKLTQMRDVRQRTVPKKQKKGWTSGAYAVLVILALLIPASGFVFGFLGVFDPAKRQQAVSLFGVGILSILLCVLFYILLGRA